MARYIDEMRIECECIHNVMSLLFDGSSGPDG